MATKSRNRFLRIIGSIIAFFMLGVATLSAFDYVGYHKYYTPYFESELFQSNLHSVFEDANIYHKQFDKYSSKSNKDKISDNEIENEKNNNSSQMEREINDLDNRYDYQIRDADNNKNKEKTDRLKEEKSKKLDEIKKKYKKSDEEIRNELVAKKDKQYDNLKTRLTESEIKYYIINDKNGETYANFSVASNIEDYIKNNSLYSIKFPRDLRTGNDSFFRIDSCMMDNGWHGYFVVPKDLKSNSIIRSSMNHHEIERNAYNKELLLGAVCLISGILLIILILVEKRKDSKLSDGKKNLYTAIPLDIRIAIFGAIIFIIAAVLNLNMGQSSLFYYWISIEKNILSEKNIYIIYSILLAAFGVFFIISNLTGAIRLLRNKEELILQCKKSIIFRICKNIFDLLIKSSSGRTLVLRVTIIMALSMLFGCTIGVLFIYQIYGDYYRNIATIYALLYLILIPAYLIKKVSYFNKILIGTGEMAAGNLDYQIKEKGHHELYKLAHNINNIKSGFKKSVEQQMKSERLKSELITNVSHDLKTPLTSIINYIDLLKNKELSKEEIEGYIGVLDRKSQRLKVLIEDLFEASKAASGTVELNIEKLDVVQLLKQTIGEFDERIKNSSLILKFNDPKKNIFLNLDGKKTWRVFENLLTNILKYSQSNTRVYIDIIEEAEKVKIVMKNISAYEMDFEVDEIFERFKRGDQSRHTEGSGLGLAIARSITELQGGSLNIEIDGDLFKVTVEFDK